MRLFQAIAVFFKILGSSVFASRVAKIAQIEKNLLDLQKERDRDQARFKLELEKVRALPREEHGDFDEGACSLLSLMQAEARFIDFIREDLADVSDAQVGGICKLVHKDLVALFSRFVKIVPVMDREEGKMIAIEQPFTSTEIRLSGNVDVKPPFEGILRHKGWMVDILNLPRRAKNLQGRILQPAEIETK